MIQQLEIQQLKKEKQQLSNQLKKMKQKISSKMDSLPVVTDSSQERHSRISFLSDEKFQIMHARDINEARSSSHLKQRANLDKLLKEVKRPSYGNTEKPLAGRAKRSYKTPGVSSKSRSRGRSQNKLFFDTHHNSSKTGAVKRSSLEDYSSSSEEPQMHAIKSNKEQKHQMSFHDSGANSRTDKNQ